MGLGEGDIEKVPKNMTVKQCYSRIYKWHKKYGTARVAQVYQLVNPYSRAYKALVGAMPLPSKATEADMCFIFREVIGNLMEWAYHQKDDYGIKTAAYAHFALEKLDKNLFTAEAPAKQSELYAQFHDYRTKFRNNSDTHPKPSGFVGVSFSDLLKRERMRP